MDVREKLEVIAHLGDHISHKEDIGICYDIALAKVIEDAYMALKNGVTVQEWISVSEPPKERGCYLVSVKHWLDGKPVTREAKWNGSDWLSCYKAEEITPRVTHWTYLPQPPKGE